MKPQRHRRFTRTEVILHGLHAAFYLTLWITGLFLIVQRTLGTEWFSIPDLSQIHRKIGVVFAVLLAKVLLLSLLIPVIRVFWKTVWEALHWTAKDIVWLLKMPLHILFPKVKLPPSGRYNPGQKINILVVLTTLSGLCLSGVWMVRVPGALVPWIIHVGCFLVGSILLGIHLYLALINPPTRQAFRAMIDGTVTLEYARIHHPLSLPPPVEQVHDHHIYRLPLFLTVILMIAALAAGLWAYGPQRFADQYRLWRQSSGMISLQPGPLTPGHAGEKESGYCTACHEDFDRPQSEPCLDCHAAIAERMDNQVGFHGKLSDRCVDCHTEHKGSDADIRPLDRKTFNHLQADFALDGAHARLDCPACHLDKSPIVPGAPRQFRFIGIEHSGCTSCHDDPHQDRRSADCLKCHTTQSWRRPELTFDHNRDSRFALQGKHARVACDKCHPDTPTKSPRIHLYDLGDCKDCHRDRHQGQFQSSCEHCHNEKGWKNINPNQFHGPESKFPLLGEHAKTACNKCHTPVDKRRRAPLKFVGLDTQCQSCHKDPHNSQFQPGCSHCHTEQTWKLANPSVFHAPSSKVPLQGKHARIECAQCHVPPTDNPKLAAAQFVGLDAQCQSCHEDPHAGQMSHSCTACHTEQDWEGPSLRFAHTVHSAFRLDAVHATVSCEKCHPQSPRPVRYRPIEHECQSCHSIQWQAMQGKMPSPQIDMAADPHWSRVTCTDCHTMTLAKPTPGDYAQRCIACHNEDYGRLYFNWLNAMRENRPSLIGLSSEKIRQIQSIGFHHLLMAETLEKASRKTRNPHTTSSSSSPIDPSRKP